MRKYDEINCFLTVDSVKWVGFWRRESVLGLFFHAWDYGNFVAFGVFSWFFSGFLLLFYCFIIFNYLHGLVPLYYQLDLIDFLSFVGFSIGRGGDFYSLQGFGITSG